MEKESISGTGSKKCPYVTECGACHIREKSCEDELDTGIRHYPDGCCPHPLCRNNANPSMKL